MTNSSAAREDRIELRAMKEEKQLLANAAACERLDVTTFIMRVVLPTARDVVDQAYLLAPIEFSLYLRRFMPAPGRS